MRFSRVRIAGFGYELPEQVVPSTALDERLAPAYAALRLPTGQVEALSGVRERRFWPAGASMHEGATRAGHKALAAANIDAADIGLLIYGGVCRDNLEPATACAVADGLGVGGRAEVYDVSNACLGVINGIVQAATAIELGRISAALVVSCESCRQIIDESIARLNREPTIERFKTMFATLTGGSGAIGVVVADASKFPGGRRLHGGVLRSAPQHHRLCRWGPDTGIPASRPQVMETHAIDVLTHGVALGGETWRDFLAELEWDGVDKSICHQVGQANRDAILRALKLSPETDYITYPNLGNIGTVSLPITAAIAEERGLLHAGDRVGFLGIGSGLNCIMLGLDW